MKEFIRKEDYEEPDCLLMSPEGRKAGRIDTRRMIKKLDEYLAANNLSDALRHLELWLGEAKMLSDLRGELEIHSELLGLLRKLERKEEALFSVERSLSLLQMLGMEDSVTGGTVMLNCATCVKAFGDTARAIELYGRAKKIYERYLEPDDVRMGGLCNNMAVALADAGRYDEAFALYRCALEIMKNTENGNLDVAMTYLNMANAAEAQHGLADAEEEIAGYMSLAEKYIFDPRIPRNGYYAHTCRKCAATFGYYGLFLVQNELLRLADEIYAGN